MSTKPLRAVIYSRVSTEDQTTENQVLALKSFAEQKGFTLVEVYQETDSAWKAGHQQELSRLLKDAYKAKFQAVLVWSLDRLSRQGVLAILSLIDRLKTDGVKVLSLQESWTEAPGELAELLYAITGWVAKFESQRRSERTKEGMARARTQSKQIGRPPGKKDKRKRKRKRQKANILLPGELLATGGL